MAGVDARSSSIFVSAPDAAPPAPVLPLRAFRVLFMDETVETIYAHAIDVGAPGGHVIFLHQKADRNLYISRIVNCDEFADVEDVSDQDPMTKPDPTQGLVVGGGAGIVGSSTGSGSH